MRVEQMDAESRFLASLGMTKNLLRAKVSDHGYGY